MNFFLSSKLLLGLSLMVQAQTSEDDPRLKKALAQWNIDPKRIGASGCSAGSLISSWIGIHRSKDVSVIGPLLRHRHCHLLQKITLC